MGEKHQLHCTSMATSATQVKINQPTSSNTYHKNPKAIILERRKIIKEVQHMKCMEDAAKPIFCGNPWTLSTELCCLWRQLCQCKHTAERKVQLLKLNRWKLHLWLTWIKVWDSHAVLLVTCGLHWKFSIVLGCHERTAGQYCCIWRT